MGQLLDFEKAAIEMGYQIIAITVDSPESIQASLTQHDIGFTVVSDSSAEVVEAFGLAYRMNDDMVEKYLSYDMDLEAASGEDHHVLPVPAVFIVSTDGVIRFQYVNPDHRTRVDPEVLTAAARVSLGP